MISIYRVYIFIVLCFAAQNAIAADQTAQTCSQPDVQAAIDACVNDGGGTVYIPDCGPEPVVWTSGVSSSSSSIFYIQGAGQDKTRIHFTGSGYVFYFRAANSGFRGMSHLEFKGDDGGTGFYFGVIGHPEIHVHHITVGNFHTAGRVIGYHGVFHHCTFDWPGSNVNPYGVYVHGLATDGWPIEDGRIVHSYGSRKALYFEDCTWYGYGHAISGFCTARYVVRNSTRFDAGTGGIDMHQSGYAQCWDGSQWLDPKNGGYQMEIYDNELYGSGVGYGIYHRSGGLLATDNIFSNFEVGATIVCEGSNNGPLCSPEYDCFLDDFDNNNCSDSDDGCCMRPDSVYVWNNSGCEDCQRGNFAVAHWGCTTSLREGKEYYLRVPNQELDGFTYNKFTYPHPLADGSGSDVDQCPDDDNKTEPGQCGCGIPETDPCNTPPQSPQLSTPADGATEISLTPSMAIGNFQDPDSGDTHSQTMWQISTTDNFSELVVNVTSNQHLTTLTVGNALEAGTTYYWRVRCIDNRGGQSQWSQTFSFTTQAGEVGDIPASGTSDGDSSSGCFLSTAGY